MEVILNAGCSKAGVKPLGRFWLYVSFFLLHFLPCWFPALFFSGVIGNTYFLFFNYVFTNHLNQFCNFKWSGLTINSFALFPSFKAIKYALPLVPIIFPVLPWNLECGWPFWILGLIIMWTKSPSSNFWNLFVIGLVLPFLSTLVNFFLDLLLNPLDLCSFITSIC